MAMEAQLQIRKASEINRPSLPLEACSDSHFTTSMQNAMEMQDYMKELFDWEKDMKKKDKKIQKGGVQPAPATAAESAQPRSLLTSSSDPALPAPRGRAATAKVSDAPASMQTPGIVPSALPGPMRHAAAPAMQAAAAASPATKQVRKKKKKAKAGPKASESGLSATAAAHTYTAGYKKWESFDVDAALKSSSESEYESGSEEEAAPAAAAAPSPAPRTAASAAAPANAPIAIAPRESSTPADMIERSTVRTAAASAAAPSSAMVSEEDRPLPPIRSSEPQTAEAWRARGNDLFKISQWSSAVECYSRSIELGPSCLSFANRAMSKLKLEQWEEAESDCTEALRLDEAFVKAYHRRGTARRKLGRPMDAALDYEQALRLDPGNAAVRSERDACLKDWMAAEGLKEPTRRSKLPVAMAVPCDVPHALAESGSDGSEERSGGMDGVGVATGTQPKPSLASGPSQTSGASDKAMAATTAAAPAAAGLVG